MLKTPDVVIVVPCLLNSNCSVYPGRAEQTFLAVALWWVVSWPAA